MEVVANGGGTHVKDFAILKAGLNVGFNVPLSTHEDNI
jgi:hypothetical protein